MRGCIMKKYHVLVVSFSYSSLSDLINRRRKMKYTCKRDRLKIVSRFYSFEELKNEYEKGFGYEGKSVNGFYERFFGEAYLNKREIHEIIRKWDTNLLVYNMHNGHEYN